MTEIVKVSKRLWTGVAKGISERGRAMSPDTARLILIASTAQDWAIVADVMEEDGECDQANEIRNLLRLGSPMTNLYSILRRDALNLLYGDDARYLASLGSKKFVEKARAMVNSNKERFEYILNKLSGLPRAVWYFLQVKSGFYQTCMNQVSHQRGKAKLNLAQEFVVAAKLLGLRQDAKKLKDLCYRLSFSRKCPVIK